MNRHPPRFLSNVAILVRDYDEAIAWYTTILGFELVEDEPRGPGKRWVRVSPGPGAQTTILLARAATDEQRAGIGRQGGGRVTFFLETDDFDGDYRRYLEQGVQFEETPRDEEYGKVAVFRDLYGNRWDLIGRRRD